MYYLQYYTLLGIFLLNSLWGIGQRKVDSETNKFNFDNIVFINTDSGNISVQILRLNCKNQIVEVKFSTNNNLQTISQISEDIEVIKEKVNFLKIHGNVQYGLNFRSYIDTPFAQKDVVQQYIQTQFNVIIQDRYPFTAYFTTRRSNSPYFLNATDLSVQFRQSEMLEDIKNKQRLRQDKLLKSYFLQQTVEQLWETELSSTKETLKNIEKQNTNLLEMEKEQKRFLKMFDEYKEQKQKLTLLERKLRSSTNKQTLIENKEKEIRGEPGDTLDSLTDELFKANPIFSKKEKFEDKFDETEEGLITLKQKLKQKEGEIKKFQKNTIDSIQKRKNEISTIKDKNTLLKYLENKEDSSTKLAFLQHALLSINQLGIGRTWLDYSELTVKNISLTGVNIEMNPGNLYFAAALGKVNYRFRDYILKDELSAQKQSVGLIRVGYGQKERNRIILSYYNGRKSLVNQYSIADTVALQRITGFSVESSFNILKNIELTGEYGRSSTLQTRNKLLNFSTSTNEAWSIKLISNYKSSRFTGYYRRMGESFQSFTLYPTNNKQDAWLLEAHKSAWKKRVTFDVGIRKNDFVSPIASPDFSNSNVFKTFRTTIKFPKYPFLSIGYYPSSQLTLSDNNVLFENRYNTLNAITNYSYFVYGIYLNSNATYTKFYNQGKDTGFIYFNAATFTFNQSVNVKSFIFQTTLTKTNQSSLKQFTAEQTVSYQFKRSFSVIGGLRRSAINSKEVLWGATAGINLYLNKLGALQLQYDKFYLPGYNRNLLPVETGRIVFTRQF